MAEWEETTMPSSGAQAGQLQGQTSGREAGGLQEALSPKGVADALSSCGLRGEAFGPCLAAPSQ